MADLHTRQGLDRLLTVTDHKRSYDGERLTATLVDLLGGEVEVGSSLGEPVGTDILINLDFDGVAEGSYELKVCSPDEIVFPPDERTFTVQVHPGC